MNEAGAEQKIFDFVVANAREMIFNETGVKSIMSKIEGNDPAKAIGHTAVMLLKSVNGGIEKSGLTVPPGVMPAAFKEIVGDLVELAAAQGAIPEESKREIAVAAAQAGVGFLADAQANAPKPGETPQQPPQPPQPPVNAGGLVNQAMGA